MRVSYRIVMMSVAVALAGAMIVAGLYGAPPSPALAAMVTLPPTFTPEPTVTPIPVPTLPPLVTEPTTNGPTLVPTITPRPFIKEDLLITAPLYYISKRFAETRYLAVALPAEGAFTTVVKFPDENIVAFDVARDGKIAYATDRGVIYAPGRTAWKSTVKTAQPMQVVNIAWSPDSTSLVFTLRADEADYATMVRNPASGVYLWGDKGDPQLVIADKPPGQTRQNFQSVAWSPNGKLLLVSFAFEAKGIVEGFGVWTLATRQYLQLLRYNTTDIARYQSALWNRDSQSFFIFLAPSKDPTAPTVVDAIELNGNRYNMTIQGAITLRAISAMRLLPDGRVVLVGSTARNQPLQVYAGKVIGNRLEVQPVGKAFRLAWPGVLLTPPSGFPLYVMDMQLGVQLFNSGRILPFYPQEMRIGSLNTTDAYGPEFFPDWRFGPAEVKLPTR